MAAIDLEKLSDALDAGYGPWLGSLTPNQRLAIENYQEGWSGRVNGYLRGDLLPSMFNWEDAQAVAAIVEDLDAALAEATAPFDFIAYRGVSEYLAVFGAEPKDLIGEEWDDPAFLSTSIDLEFVVDQFALEPSPALVQLAVARGAPAGWIRGAGGTQYYHEGEVLLPPGTPILIDSATKDRTGLLVIQGSVLSG